MTDYDDFVLNVAMMLGDEPDSVSTAQRATEATLQTLAERLGKDEAANLVPQLGPDLGGLMYTADPPQAIPLREFLTRIAEREGVDIGTARRHTEAVFAPLAGALGDREYGHVKSRLPTEFMPLLPKD
jgi:uncharacterized protein (DUF2267 family)